MNVSHFSIVGIEMKQFFGVLCHIIALGLLYGGIIVGSIVGIFAIISGYQWAKDVALYSIIGCVIGLLLLVLSAYLIESEN